MADAALTWEPTGEHPNTAHLEFKIRSGGERVDDSVCFRSITRATKRLKAAGASVHAHSDGGDRRTD